MVSSAGGGDVATAATPRPKRRKITLSAIIFGAAIVGTVFGFGPDTGPLPAPHAVATAQSFDADEDDDADDGEGRRQQPPARAERFDWRDAVIYQLLTDRFANGDTTNDFNVDRASPYRYHGGDFAGITQQIPYLQALGVNAVWISPVIANVEEHLGQAGYHGYWPQDFSKVNPHFGDLDALKHMVEQLQAAGIRVIGDIVVNHIGQLFFYDVNGDGKPGPIEIDTTGRGPATEWAPPYDPMGIRRQVDGEVLRELAPIVWLNDQAANRVPPGPEPFQRPAMYSRRGEIWDWNNRDQVLYGDFPGGLKDLRTWEPDVRREIIKVYVEWLEKIPFDGYRIDSIKHVDLYFFIEFCREIRRAATRRPFILIGEAFDHDDELVGQYTRRGALDTVLNFGQKTKVIDPVIKHGHATKAAGDHLGTARRRFYGDAPQPDGIGIAPAFALVNFIDNHDVPRFLSGIPQTQRIARLNLALGYIFCAPGIPCLYYGTEHGFAGGDDPHNREALWPTEFATTGPYFSLVRRWIDLRASLPALRHGECVVRWSTERTGDEVDAGIFAFERLPSLKEPESLGVLVVMNVKAPTEPNAGEGEADSRTEWSGQGMPVSFRPGTALRDLLDSSYTVEVTTAPRNHRLREPGRVVVSVQRSGIRVLVPIGSE